MIKRILVAGAVAGAVAFPFLAAFAQAVPQGTLTIASSSASNALASVGNIFSDAGVAAWVILAAAVPLFFYVVKQLIALLPHSRGARRT